MAAKLTAAAAMHLLRPVEKWMGWICTGIGLFGIHIPDGVMADKTTEEDEVQPRFHWLFVVGIAGDAQDDRFRRHPARLQNTGEMPPVHPMTG